MRVKMQSIYANPKQTAQVGDIISVSPEEGKYLIDNRFAIPAPTLASQIAETLRRTKEYATRPTPETPEK
jgi:hypothetical protein